MKIKIKVIGPLIYDAGFSEQEIEVPAGSTLEEVLCRISIPENRARIVTRNGNAVADREILSEGDSIAVSPIYSGG
jgi:sulfur carrier protein ThiS